MEEHLWTSSFWRLLSNCSDSRKLLILQKIILHKLGNVKEIDLRSKLPNDKQNKLINSSDKSEHPISQSNMKNTEEKIVRVPVMGTNALLSKYQNCVQSTDSKIIANLVNTKFNKEVMEQKQCNLELFNISAFVLDDTPITFDEEKFLEDALGNEIGSLTSTECPEYEDEYTTQQANRSISITSSRVSSLISVAASVYASLKKRLHRPTNSTIPEPKPNIQPTVIHTELDLLLQEASIQHQIIIESCKALNVCWSSKEFLFGRAHVETERILLLAMYKQNNILTEMKQLKCITEKGICKGYANVSQLKFPLSTKTQKEGCTNWFVAIVSCGKNVSVTNAEVVDCDNVVQFQEVFKFDDLQYDFEIDVSIYSFLARNNPSNGDTTDYLKNEETVTCLKTPDKLLFRRNSIKQKQHCCERREPSFKLCGKTTLTIPDLERTTPFQLQQIPTTSIIKGIALIHFNMKVEFEENHSGFLTLRTECDKSIAWNHRWCNIIGHTLYYWNYPTDQDLVEPIGKINLQQCITSKIDVVDRNLCARPRTLLIETVESCDDSGKIFLRHFLSADSTETMTVWKDRLNATLSELIKWNLMKCKVQLM